MTQIEFPKTFPIIKTERLILRGITHADIHAIFKNFSDPDIAAYINEHFYAVKLDAEQKELIHWNDQEFKWIPNGRNGVHTLAYALCDGKMSYPSLVYLNENYDRIRISKGFKDVDTLLPELQFAAEEQYLKNATSPRPVLDGR